MTFHLSEANDLTGPLGNARLLPKEAAILRVLMQHPGELTAREPILEAIRTGRSYAPSWATAKVHVSRLRRKLSAVGGPGMTGLYKLGYVLAGAGEETILVSRARFEALERVAETAQQAATRPITCVRADVNAESLDQLRGALYALARLDATASPSPPSPR